MMTLPLYIVIAGRIEPYFVERETKDCTWAGTVRDIADVQFVNLRQVIEVGTGRDVTALMVREACDLYVNEQRDNNYGFAQLVELTLGTRAARPFFQRAA